MAAEIVTTIITALTSFVTGLGGAFVDAFQRLFMIAGENGSYSGINDLGIFILVFFGISIGYGVIRWITGLFRREAR